MDNLLKSSRALAADLTALPALQRDAALVEQLSRRMAAGVETAARTPSGKAHFLLSSVGVDAGRLQRDLSSLAVPDAPSSTILDGTALDATGATMADGLWVLRAALSAVVGSDTLSRPASGPKPQHNAGQPRRWPRRVWRAAGWPGRRGRVAEARARGCGHLCCGRSEGASFSAALRPAFARPFRRRSYLGCGEKRKTGHCGG